MNTNRQITVTSPLLPPLEEFVPYLEDIWNRKWLTNNGHYHQELEKALCEYLKVPFISLFTNGTLPIMTALQALRITGEVITTPYSFVATTHSLLWNDIIPVFVDIDEKTGNIDPNKIEEAITAKTTAILPVHCYGNPCDVEKIQKIADKYGLKVIYDAAHAFGVEINSKSILEYGDMATLSFHATKTYNTIEGGALICRSEAEKKRIDYLKNFGFASETEVIMDGINGKLDEVRAAYGLLNLKYVDDAIENRKKITGIYRKNLREIDGISFFDDISGVKSNYSYFPIFIDSEKYGKTRDELYEYLKTKNILGRRYFFPLISTFSPYKTLPSSKPKNLPIATKIAEQVICLPIYADLSISDVELICETIREEK